MDSAVQGPKLNPTASKYIESFLYVLHFMLAKDAKYLQGFRMLLINSTKQSPSQTTKTWDLKVNYIEKTHLVVTYLVLKSWKLF